MKPNDKAIEAAIRYLEAPMSAREQMEQILTAAYAAQFQSEEYAELVKELRDGIIEHRRRFAGDTHDDLGGTADYEKTHAMTNRAADALEAALAERDALKAERDALAARLAPVEDEALVERDALKKAVEAEQSMTNLRLGPFLKKVRQEKQMTLRAVEEATDKEISNAYLSQLESGKIANPSPHVLYTLSLVFGVAYETLMERAGYIMPAPNRLAPVDDEALVEIAAHCEAIFDGWTFSSLERLSQDVYRVRAHQLLASIRPHIEAAERERCAKIAEGSFLFDIETWLNSTKKEMTAHVAKAIAAAIRSWK